jgi:hypothetical protein
MTLQDPQSTFLKKNIADVYNSVTLALTGLKRPMGKVWGKLLDVRYAVASSTLKPNFLPKIALLTIGKTKAKHIYTTYLLFSCPYKTFYLLFGTFIPTNY